MIFEPYITCVSSTWEGVGNVDWSKSVGSTWFSGKYCGRKCGGSSGGSLMNSSGSQENCPYSSIAASDVVSKTTTILFFKKKLTRLKKKQPFNYCCYPLPPSYPPLISLSESVARIGTISMKLFTFPTGSDVVGWSGENLHWLSTINYNTNIHTHVHENKLKRNFFIKPTTKIIKKKSTKGQLICVPCTRSTQKEVKATQWSKNHLCVALGFFHANHWKFPWDRHPLLRETTWTSEGLGWVWQMDLLQIMVQKLSEKKRKRGKKAKIK